MDFKGSENGQSLKHIDILLFVIAKIVIYFRSDVAFLRSKVIIAFPKVLLREKGKQQQQQQQRDGDKIQPPKQFHITELKRGFL